MSPLLTEMPCSYKIRVRLLHMVWETCDFEDSRHIHLVALVSSPQGLSSGPALNFYWVPLRLRNNHLVSSKLPF